MSKATAPVDGYIRKNKRWRAELEALRAIVLESPLTEEVKWMVPCYTLGGKPVAFLNCLKESCVISFTKGALLKDPHGVLIQQTKNSQQVRVIRFKTADEVTAMAAVLKAYVAEATALEQSGAKVPLKTTAEFDMPEEFRAKLDESTALEEAFEALTPGRQRAYLLHFAGAKQSKTRTARVEKWVPHILDGKGIDDE